MALVELDRLAPEPLSRQVYSRLREMILQGRLAGDFRLPPTRELAQELQVSRNVVLAAYDQLYAEGYVYSRRGAGTFVCRGGELKPGPEGEFPPLPPEQAVPSRPMTLSGVDTQRIDFRSGLPDLEQFPRRIWQQLTREVFESSPSSFLAYGHPEGHPALREAVADYLGTYRGIRCSPDRILITAGTTQAIGLLTRLLCPPGGKGVDAVVEDPLTADIKRIIALNGGRCHPVPIDEEGLDARRIPARLDPGFIYVTPSHQFPLGSTMSAPRRISLLEYAREHKAYVIEDDYDSEFRFDVQPVQSFYELDRTHVIYCGTFSKTVFPALRMAYLILPPGLFQRGRELKWYADLHNATMDQLVLARFLREGHFVRHLGKMKKRYQTRRGTLVSCLKELFREDVRILGCEAGLHLCAQFSRAVFTPAFREEMKGRGLLLYPAGDHSCFPGRYGNVLIFGYGRLSSREMRRGLEILRSHL